MLTTGSAENHAMLTIGQLEVMYYLRVLRLGMLHEYNL